jgi:6,7-dimethyl-8-ribityllumazine synthase
MQKILIIQAPYYKKISQMLLEGAINELQKNKLDFDVLDVPGALEIPTAISMVNENKKYDGFVALGCVIRGETTHYDYVCQESAHGLSLLALNKHIAIGNGIITTENEQQAIARSDIKQKNKGGFAAKTCIEMIKIKNLS